MPKFIKLKTIDIDDTDDTGKPQEFEGDYLLNIDSIIGCYHCIGSRFHNDIEYYHIDDGINYGHDISIEEYQRLEKYLYSENMIVGD